MVTEIRIWSLKQLYLFLFSFSSNTSCFMIWWQPTVLSVFLYAAPTMVCHLSILCLLICVFVYLSLFLYLYFYVFNVVCTLCWCHTFISLDTAVLTAIVDDIGYHKIMRPLILCTFLYVYNHMLPYVVYICLMSCISISCSPPRPVRSLEMHSCAAFGPASDAAAFLSGVQRGVSNQRFAEQDNGPWHTESPFSASTLFQNQLQLAPLHTIATRMLCLSLLSYLLPCPFAHLTESLSLFFLQKSKKSCPQIWCLEIW